MLLFSLRHFFPLKPEMHVLSHSLSHQLLSTLALLPSASLRPGPLQVNAT